eukprot:jgi/Chlat1/5662/Chrsp37S05480
MAPNLMVPEVAMPAIINSSTSVTSPPPPAASAVGNNGRRAYVTLLTGENYLPGVLALRRSLQQMRSAYPLICMVTPVVSRETRRAMEEADVQVVEVPPFIPMSEEDLVRLNYKVASFLDCWLKLRLWEMEEYETVVYMDADMIAVQNIDSLFDVPIPEDGVLATLDCWCGRKVEADRCPMFCSVAPAATSGPIMDPTAYSRKKGSAHIHGETVNSYFNAGLMVLKPDRAVFDAMGRYLSNGYDFTKYQFAEQDFLNEFYTNRWAALPYTCNAMKLLPYFHKDMWSAAELKVLALDKRNPSPADYHLALLSVLTNEKSADSAMNAIKRAELDGIIIKPVLQLYVRWWATMAGAA